jgi:SsrA-binding protein
MAEGEKLIASHPTARSDYHIEEVVEAGIQLTGTEVKSIRDQSPSLKDAFVDVQPSGSGDSKSGLEAWLMQAHIAPYSHGNINNHEPLRKRKLLLHRHQINRLFGAITQDGLTIIPLRMYFKKGRVKMEIALARGKKKHDKREDIKKRSAEREMDQARKRGRSGER